MINSKLSFGIVLCLIILILVMCLIILYYVFGTVNNVTETKPITTTNIDFMDSASIIKYTDYVLERSRMGYSLPESNIKMNFVCTYNVSDDNIFYKWADIYDNSLALLYFITTNQLNSAYKLYSSLDRLFHKYGSNLLFARYRPNGNVDYSYNGKYNDDLIGVTNVRDLGNNTYLGIAFVKYGLTYHIAGAIENSFDIIEQIKSREIKYNNNIVGYKARSQKNYVSMEHMIDIYALCNIMLENISLLKNIYKIGDIDNKVIELEQMRKNCRIFANEMYNDGKYYIGTTDEKYFEVNTTSAIPADCQTWNILSGIDSINTEHQRKSIKWCVDNCILNDTYSSNTDIYTGFRFSEDGTCIQLENTGSGLMAFVKINNTEADIDYTKIIEKIQSSIVRLCNRSPDGIVSSFRNEKLTLSEGEFNTGLTWSYWDSIHTASTIYCSLSLLYIESGGDELFNPYGTKIKAQNNQIKNVTTSQYSKITEQLNSLFENSDTVGNLSIQCDPSNISSKLLQNYSDLYKRLATDDGGKQGDMDVCQIVRPYITPTNGLTEEIRFSKIITHISNSVTPKT